MYLIKYFLITLFLLISFSSCMEDQKSKLDFSNYNPREVNDGWLLSSPENEKMDKKLIDSAYNLVYRDDRFVMARSLIIIRNGKIVAESYINNPSDINMYYNIQSCTKSFSSLMIGVAINDKVINSLNRKIYDIIPDIFDTDNIKRTITLRDALTMQTGLEFDNSIHTLKLYQYKKNSANFVISQNRVAEPGTSMNYNDGAPQLISAVIGKLVGKSEAQYANEKLFTPLNIKDWYWESAHDGVTYGAFGLYLKPRDFAKIGLLLLQNGVWNGHRIIDSAYLEEATKTQVISNYNNLPYGYYFWVHPELKGFSAEGHGGQFLLVIPKKQLIVVYTAWPYTSPLLWDDGQELMKIIANSCY
jgi:CubicO group peptidase (beta-lactamase class C family)